MTVENVSQLPYQDCVMTIFPEDVQDRVRDITNYFAIPLNMLVATISFVCNALVVYTVVRTKSLHQPPLLMLCSLAVTDVIFPPYNLFRYIEILAHEHMCPGRASDEIAALAPLCLLATLGNLAIISRDRYLAVRKAVWYRTHVTKSRAMKMICVAWSTSAVVSFMLYLSRKFEGRFPPLGQIMSLVFYLVCFFVIVVSYLGIFCKTTPAEEALHLRAIFEREKRTANTVGLILLVLLVTFLPGLLIPLVLNAKGVPNFTIYTPFYGFLWQLNCLLNPLLNFGRSKEMRRALRELLRFSQQIQPLSTASASQQQHTAAAAAAAATAATAATN